MSARELLEEVKRRIVADPGKYDQNTYCGTSCCIAGHIDVILNGSEKHISRGINTGDAIDQIASIALEALGEPEDIWLFAQPMDVTDGSDDWDNEEISTDCWPVDLSQEYEDATSAAERAAVACKAIDRYMQDRGL